MEMKRNLTDTHGREFHYLRLSVTDVCNFQCTYCLPQGYQKEDGTPSPLSVSEILHLIQAFAAVGFWKIRLTGGEPTVRRDIVEIASAVSQVPGIRQVALSTNGYRLAQLALPLKEAGVSLLNVSIDSLDPEQFKNLTGQDRLKEVLAGIQKAFEVGFSRVKVNVVLMKDRTDLEWDSFLLWAKDTPMSIRFIELMETSGNRELFRKHHISAGDLQLKLLRTGWKMKERASGEGPASEFVHPDYLGRIGLIAPYSKDFCQSCNRLRVTSQGGLRLCLFGDKDYSLRPLLQSANQKEELIAAVQNLIGHKEVSHYLQENNYGNTRNFSAMGG